MTKLLSFVLLAVAFLQTGCASNWDIGAESKQRSEALGTQAESRLLAGQRVFLVESGGKIRVTPKV